MFPKEKHMKNIEDLTIDTTEKTTFYDNITKRGIHQWL